MRRTFKNSVVTIGIYHLPFTQIYLVKGGHPQTSNLDDPPTLDEAQTSRRRTGWYPRGNPRTQKFHHVLIPTQSQKN
jgi:hypothetical protein